MNTTTFEDLNLPENLLQAIKKLGFEAPSDIQAAAIPPAMAGEDIIGLSETGSGKTAAFGLPALASIDLNARHPQVLVLCPTRELAVQVCEEIHRLAADMDGFRAVPVYGGVPIDKQMRSLDKNPQIIVGTPGRLLDHLRRKSFNPRTIKMAILDEADRMLDMGFREEMEGLLAQLSPNRQTLFFSATMNKNVNRLIEKFGNEPRTIQIKRKTLTVESVEQRSYEVRQRSKIEVLSRIIDLEQPRLAIIFCNTKRVVDEVTETLLARGYAADRLHGDISQIQRERTLKRFRDGNVELLVATDVAARGIDIDDIDMVFNYDLPQDPEDYVHRIGRTGRAGRTGCAISFIFGRDIYRIQTIERYIKQPIPRARIPSLEQVQGILTNLFFENIKERLEKGQLPDVSDQLDRLLEQGHSATDICAALYDLLQESSGRKGEEIIEDNPNAPRTDRKQRRDRDDSDRGERQPREKREFNDSKMSTLFLNLGKSHQLGAKDIAGMLYNEAGLPRGSVGKIKLFDRHSLIDVETDHADQAVKATKGSTLRGKEFRMDFDKKK